MNTQLLEQNTINIEQPAVNDRFFNASEVYGVEQLPCTNAILGRHIDEALVAMGALATVERARNVKETARACPGSVREYDLDEAHGRMVDQGTIWRRTTDGIARSIVAALPRQTFGRITGSDEFFTDNRYLLSTAPNGGLRAYTSFIAQKELNDGVRIASEDHWQSLLAHIITRR